MKIYKTLESLKSENERKTSGVSRENFVTLRSGESARLIFRQELSEDGANYDSRYGAAGIFHIHVSPVDFVKKYVCTSSSEEDQFRCWGCVASKIPGNESMKVKRRLLINVLQKVNDVWVPKVLETSLSFRGNQPGNLLVAFQEEYGTLMDREYKFSRLGEQLNTSYNIIPFSTTEMPSIHNEAPIIDTANVFMKVRYEDQEEFMLTERTMTSAAAASKPQPSNGSDW